MCLIKDGLFWGVVVFRHHVIIGIEMLSKWRHPSIVDRILKSISFPCSESLDFVVIYIVKGKLRKKYIF
jgi:hypothetical protein